MNDYIPWNSQSLEVWRRKHAPGRTIELDGRSTHYLKAGGGETLILLHGFNMDHNTWASNFNALALEYTVYAVDLWGLGYSTREVADPGYALYCEQLLRFMDALEIESATLVGHSMGGGTAITFTIHYPERVRRLILVDSTGIPNNLPLRSKLFSLPGVGEFLTGINNDYFRRKNLKDIWFHEQERLTDEVFQQITRFQKIKGTSEILLDILRRDFFHTLDSEIDQLGELAVPILVVWGRHDASIPLEIGREMHRRLPGSSLKIIDNGGHMPNWDSPAEFNQALLDFIRDTPAPQPDWIPAATLPV